MATPTPNQTLSHLSPSASLQVAIQQDKTIRSAWVSLGSPRDPLWRHYLAAAENADLGSMLQLAEQQARPAPQSEISKVVAILAGLPSRAQSADEVKASMAIYLLGLEDVPGELLALAVKRAAVSCTFRPTPAELRALIADEISERTCRVVRLREAAR